MDPNALEVLNSAVEKADSYYDFNPKAGPHDRIKGNPFEGGLFEKWFRPGDVQQREFGQQMALLQYQSEPEKMKRLQEAGINPLLAAGGVASSSPSPVGVPHQDGGLSLGEVAQGLSAVTGGIESVANAAFKEATKDATVKELEASADKQLADKGLTDEQIYAWKVDNKYRDDNAQVELRTKLLNEKNVAKQWEVMHAQYELMTTQLDTELAKQKELYERAKLDISQAGLADAEKAYYDKLKEKTDYEAQFAQIRVKWWNEQGYDILNSSADAILAQRIENGKSNSDIIRTWSDYYGSRTDAEQQSMAKYVHANAFNAAAGANEANMDFEWDTPPKTMFEFFSKAVANWKEKWRKNHQNTPIPDDESQLDKPTKDELRQSYLDYRSQLDRQYTILNLQHADNIDNNGNIIEYNKHEEYVRNKSKLDKMPKSYREWKRYVNNH